MAGDKTLKEDVQYVTARGLRPVSPGELNASLRLALDSMSVILHGETTHDLTEAEQAVLRRGGLVLKEQLGPDPLAETAAKFAAIIESSLSTTEVGKRLRIGPGRIRQMVADRTLFSIRLEGRRHIPILQFVKGHLVPNIGRVNAALNPELHPVEVFDWYTMPNPDLFDGDDYEQTVSPRDWLKAGNDPEPVVRLAKLL
jgi:hypothetical protein